MNADLMKNERRRRHLTDRDSKPHSCSDSGHLDPKSNMKNQKEFAF